jgi:flagellar protein FlaG
MASELLDAANATQRLRGTPVSPLEPIRDRQTTDQTRQEPLQPKVAKQEMRDEAPSVEKVRELVEQLRPAMRDLELEVDDSTDQVVVRIRDRETGEVLRQIPSEKLLELSRSLQEIRDNQSAVDAVSGDENPAGHPPKGVLIQTSA